MLKNIRDQIDALDKEIVSNLEKRFNLVLKMKNLNLKKNIEDKKREKDILRKIENDEIKNIYKEIFKISKKIQS